MKRKDIKSIRRGLFILNESIDKLRYGIIQKGIIDDISCEQLLSEIKLSKNLNLLMSIDLKYF